MVLSLAFILALVFSAIVLLIGIVIFSEVVEAMEVTLPTQGTVLPPLQAISQGNLTANNEWQLREQGRVVSASVFCNFLDTDPTRFLMTSNPASSRAWCHIFKVFDKSDIIGKTVTVTWQGSSGDSTTLSGRIAVHDGAFDRNNATQFPLDNSSIVFGGYLQAELNELHDINLTMEFGQPIQSTTTDSILMTMIGSTKDQVTITITLVSTSTSTIIALNPKILEISDFAKWTWGSNAGATVTMEVTGTNGNDLGVSNAKLENLLPLVLSESDQQQVDTFENAQAIGFTVIGILPVALFFALFSIFSGRFE